MDSGEILTLLFNAIFSVFILGSQEYLKQKIASNGHKIDFNTSETVQAKDRSIDTHRCLDETKQVVLEIRNLLAEKK